MNINNQMAVSFFNIDIRLCSTLPNFKRRLKTYLFK